MLMWIFFLILGFINGSSSNDGPKMRDQTWILES